MDGVANNSWYVDNPYGVANNSLSAGTDALIQHYLVALRPRRGVHEQTISSGTREQRKTCRVRQETPLKAVLQLRGWEA